MTNTIQGCNKCSQCGKFNSWKNLAELGCSDNYGGEDVWLECVNCVSKVDYNRYFNKEISDD